MVILKSIKPYFLWLILTGQKTVELSWNMPRIRSEWITSVYFYCTKDLKSFNRIPKSFREGMIDLLGKVACVCYCDTFYEIENEADFQAMLGYHVRPGISWKEASLYLGNKKGFGWYIPFCLLFEEPRDLSDYGKVVNGNFVPLKRPPQSWMYVQTGINGEYGVLAWRRNVK